MPSANCPQCRAPQLRHKRSLLALHGLDMSTGPNQYPDITELQSKIAALEAENTKLKQTAEDTIGQTYLHSKYATASSSTQPVPMIPPSLMRPTSRPMVSSHMASGSSAAATVNAEHNSLMRRIRAKDNQNLSLVRKIRALEAELARRPGGGHRDTTEHRDLRRTGGLGGNILMDGQLGVQSSRQQAGNSNNRNRF